MKDDFDPMGSRRDAFDFATGMSKALHGIEAAKQTQLLEEQNRLQREANELAKQKLAQSEDATQATASSTSRHNKTTLITFDNRDTRFQEVERERTAILEKIKGSWSNWLDGSTQTKVNLQRERWGEEQRSKFELILKETKLSRRKEMLHEFEKKYGKVEWYSNSPGKICSRDKHFFGWEWGTPEEDGDIRCRTDV